MTGPFMVATIEIPLPCGHTLTHVLRSEGEAKNGAEAERFCKHAGERLGYWAKHRLDVRQHDCALVGPGNPGGIRPKDAAP